MLRIYSSTHIQPLADHLGSVLSTPLDDPMATEWVAVPSAGMERWLKLELSRTLGAHPDRSDGIAANIDFAFPGSLRSRLLADSDEPDPWKIEHLVWTVLHVLTTSHDPELEVVKQLPPGASWFSRARHIADLFDRYSYHRPRMIRDWQLGRNNEGSGGDIPAHMLWQPQLWRLVRAHIGKPSPAERLSERLAEIAQDPAVIDLPSRLAIFGVSTLPGGPQFIELLGSVGATRDVHLYLLDPSVVSADAIAQFVDRNPLVGGARAEDRSDTAIANPLLSSWARPTREAQVQLAHAVHDGEVGPIERLPFEPTTPQSLLARMQADVVINAKSSANFAADPGDNSLQVHSCHGSTRQVEVLKDVILGLLAADETLTEEDVLVVVPDIAKFAPLVGAVFGQPAGLNSQTQPSPAQPPTLRYRITDRSLRSSYPLLNATSATFDLISGRFGASDVLDFCALTPIRDKFGFTDDHLADIARWVDGANIRWGLDGEHRSRWGMPETFNANSWRSGLDQLLMGVAVHDDQPSFGPGDIPPYGVEGSDVETLGRFAELLFVLSSLVHDAASPKSAGEWCSLTSQTLAQISEVPWSEQWQRQRLAKVLDTIGRNASVEPQETKLTLGDFRRLLGEYLIPPASRAGFFEGGITVTSLQPMRWLPHRVVCLLGADSEVFSSSGVNGDDLVAIAPRVGDPDPRGERRQSMLETMMSAGQHFVVTRTGRDLRVNAPVPPAVPVLELLETAHATLHPDHKLELEFPHARQANDETNFVATPTQSPFGFDPRAMEAARARQDRSPERAPFLAEPLPEHSIESVDLARLHSFFRRPVRYFFNERLDAQFAQAQEAKPDHLPVDLDPLEKWQLGMDLIDAGFSRANARRFISIQQARGALPPGRLGDAQVVELTDLVEEMFALLSERGLSARDDHYEVNALLGKVQLDGHVSSWSRGPNPGPINLTYSAADGRHKLDLWLDLLAMTVTDSDQNWRALGLARRPKTQSKPASAVVTTLQVKGSSPEERRLHAEAGLSLAVDLYRRGLREPLPLFPKSSPEIAAGKNISSKWDGGLFSERGDDYHAEVFGHLDAVALREIPLRGDEPFGNGDDRAARFAHVLWDAVATTTVEIK